MRILTLVLASALSLGVQAQKIADPKPFANSITAEDLKKHLYIVAGAEMEGRETATEGQRKAAAYIENEFRRIGLQPGNNGSYYQYFNVYQDSLVEAHLEVNGQPFVLDKDFNLNIANSTASTLRFSEAVWIGPATTDSVKNMNLAGRLVIMPAPAGGGNRAAMNAHYM